jgi:zinc protease
MKRPAAVCMLALALARCAAGAEAPASEDAWRAAAARLDETLAGVERLTLDNGLTVLLRRDMAAPVAAVQIWVGSGSIHEDRHLGAGLCHAIEHMIFKGTPTRGPGEITRTIHDAGGKLNAYTTFDRTVFHVTLPARHWTVGLDVLSDAVRHAVFSEEEWAREQDVIRREIAMNRDDPDRELGRVLWETAFRAHPYRYPVIGYTPLFDRLTAADLAEFARSRYVPDNMIVVVVGDIPRDEMLAGVRAAWGDAERRLPPYIPIPEEPAQVTARTARRTGPYTLSRLAVAWHSVPLSHPDAAVLDVLAEIVGQGRSGTLTLTLKEERALVSAISAWSYTPREPGLFGISATCEPEREAEVVRALDAAVAEWKTTLFPDAAVAKARRRVIVGALARLAGMDGQADAFASGEFYAGDPGFDAAYVRRVAAVTPEQLREAARRTLRETNRTCVILAPDDVPAAAPAAAPAPEPVRRVTLSSGIPVLVRPDPRLPLAWVCAAVGGGVLAEDAASAGVTHMVSELLLRGTAAQTGAAIAEAVESRGATLNPFSGMNSFGLQGRCLAAELGDFMALLGGCLLEPAFPEEAVTKQKQFQAAALKEKQDQPFFVARQGLRGLLFADHPYRFDPLGTPESIAGLTRDRLAAYHRAHVGRGNLVLAVFGDVTPEHVRAACEPVFGVIAGADWTAPAAPAAGVGPGLPACLVREEPRQQAIILMGFPGVDLFDPRAEALEVLSAGLSGLSSELAVRVRDERGLAYFVGAFEQSGLHPGLFALYAGTRADAVDEVETLFHDEIRRRSAEGLSDAELDRSRNRLTAAFDMTLQDNGTLAMQTALYELYGLGADYFLGRRARLDAVTPDAVRAAAAAILKPDRMAVSTVLPEGAGAAATENP